MCQHDPTFQIDNESNGGQGCPRCNGKRVVMVQHVSGAQEVDPTFGPQPAPSDYRIANRPGNQNWRSVAAWFDEAAGLLPKLYGQLDCDPSEFDDDELTPQQIADMRERCNETERAEDYSSGTESTWM